MPGLTYSALLVLALTLRNTGSPGQAMTTVIQISNSGRIETLLRDLAAHFARVLLVKSRPLQSEGAGNAERPMRPIAACARSVVERTRVSRSHRNLPALPAQWFTAYFVLSPATGLSCHRRPRKLPFANLTPASGRQDHTSSPSASHAVRYRRIRVHRIPPRVRDDHDTPLCGVGRESI